MESSVYACQTDLAYSAIQTCCLLTGFLIEDLSVVESRVLKSSAIIVVLSISPFSSDNICFIHLGISMLGAYVFTIIISS